MTNYVEARQLKDWLADGGEIALIDVREHGQFGERHPLFAVPAPYSVFESRLAALVPNTGVRLVLCDERGNEDLGSGASTARAITVNAAGRPQVLRDVADVAAQGGC